MANAEISDEGKQVILPAMQRIEAADPDRKLAGLEHMLKGEDRLKEKIADEMTAKPALAIGNAIDTVVDPVRFTFTYSPQRYADLFNRFDVAGRVDAPHAMPYETGRPIYVLRGMKAPLQAAWPTVKMPDKG